MNPDSEPSIFTFDNLNDEIATNVLAANGFNIVGADVNAFDATNDDNIINADPTSVFAFTEANSADSLVLAGTLADNGGAVQTVALAANALNPALDAGVDNALINPVEVSRFIDENRRDFNNNGDIEDTIDSQEILAGADSIDDFEFDSRGTGFVQPVDQTLVANNGINTIDLGAFELQTQVEAPNAAPVITSNGGDAAAISIVENTTAVTDVVASDDDAGVTFSLSTTDGGADNGLFTLCLLYTSPSPRDGLLSRMPSSA